MLKLKYIDQSLKKAWEDLVTTNPASGYMQSFFWAEFSNSIGWETYKIGIFNREKLIGGAIVAKYRHLKNKSILYIPEGPVIPYDDRQSEIMFNLLISEIDSIADFKGIRKTSHLSIEPKLAEVPTYFSRFKKAPLDRQPVRTLIQDLTLSEKQILGQMKPKGRYNIKIADKHEVKIIALDPREGIGDFYELYKLSSKRNSFEAKSWQYFENLAIILSSAKTGMIYFACYKNKILSSAIVIYYGNTATYLYGASSKEFPQVMSAYKLHFEIMSIAKKLKYKFYDWYGLAPDDDYNHPWSGFSNFKKKFGGREARYIGAYDFIYNKKLYEDYLKNDR